MTNIESISPYTIVEEDGLYGITNKTGELIVPCVMDEISNEKDDEIGLETWIDFDCVIIRKNGKYGFFTTNGKLIEPAYEAYAIDPCGNDIHVRTDNGYGVFSAPGYMFEELIPQYSLLEEIEHGYFDEDMDDFFEENEKPFDLGSMEWDETGVEQNVVSAVTERLHAFGYAYAQDLWNTTCNDNNHVNIEKFVDDILSRLGDYAVVEEKLGDIKAQGECDETRFWEMVETKDEECIILLWCIRMAMRGVASFVSLKSMEYANIPLLNRKISELLKNNGEDGYYSTFRVIDRLLPRPKHCSFDIIPVKFPAGKRPSCKYTFIGDEIDGEIGEIYLYEHAMHTYSVCVNIYDPETPEELIQENHILDISDIVLSELLICLQEAIDPTKENTELSAAIEKSLYLENSKSPLAQILADCGIHLLSLSDFGRSPRFYDGNIAEDVDYIYVSGDDVMLILDSRTLHVNAVPLNERCGNYSWIVQDIKAAANTAYKKYENSL